MSVDFLHNHSQFPDLIRIVAQQKGIDPALVGKDYWIMHRLLGLQKLDMKFELKRWTSLSKGLQTINRFSEDIDIRIEPPPGRDVKTGRNQTKPPQVKSRKDFFYNWPAQTIRIDGIEKVERDIAFDAKDLFSGGIRPFYKGLNEPIEGLRDGVLLELGFDDVTPDTPEDISSWAYDYAAGKLAVTDNRAKAVACYDPRYTFVEKLQAISTTYRRQQAAEASPVIFMRHYYDVYSLLKRPDVQAFIGTAAHGAHKAKRFRQADNSNIEQNEAFILSNPETRKLREAAIAKTSALYYGEKPTFTQILDMISNWAERL
jgi:hypothetical protein